MKEFFTIFSLIQLDNISLELAISLLEEELRGYEKFEIDNSGETIIIFRHKNNKANPVFILIEFNSHIKRSFLKSYEKYISFLYDRDIPMEIDGKSLKITEQRIIGV
jgi:hypothetical protein